MIMFPISDYPTSSDPISRNQALTERRGDINQAMQDIDQSNLPQYQKDRINDHLSNQKADIDAKVRHNLNEQAYEKKLTDRRIVKNIEHNKELSHQTFETRHMDRKV